MKSLLMVALIFVTGVATGWSTARNFSPAPATAVTPEECSELLKTALGNTVRSSAAWAGDQLNRMAGKE